MSDVITAPEIKILERKLRRKLTNADKTKYLQSEARGVYLFNMKLSDKDNPNLHSGPHALKYPPEK